jgi:pyruvate dehydrogenase E2 component (dihydrolipoamide acetyltransferase)
MAVEVFIPKMSDHMEAGEIVEWLVSEGDRVEEGQAIVEIMTDKVTAQIEAPAAGVVKGIRNGVNAGVSVSVGETIAYIAQEGEDIPELPALVEKEGEKPLRKQKPEAGKGSEQKQGKSGSYGLKASPAARRKAKEHDIDISNVKGSGPHGLITEEDVISYYRSKSK